MKKYISFILAITLVLPVLALAGCGKEEETATETETAVTSGAEDGAIVGGVESAGNNGEVALPADENEVFAKATAGASENYRAVAYLGSQVVSGTNYAYLCEVTGDSGTTLDVVTVYEDLEGNTSVSSDEEVTAASFMKNADVTYGQTTGGYDCSEATGCGLEEEALTAFEKVAAEQTDVEYTPVALLGSQVVAGMNYIILCKATKVEEEPVSALVAMTVYADLSGNADITYICPFEF